VNNLGASRTDVKLGAAPPTTNFFLLYELVKRDLAVRFAGSAFGFSWALFHPLSLVVLYWFVFTKMMPRGSIAESGDFVLYLISGLLPWLAIQEGVIRAMTSIVDNGALVRRLTFKSELLAVVPHLSACFFELIGLAIFLIYLLATRGVEGTLWLLPMAIILQLALQLGIGWMLAVVFVFLRDVGQVLSFLLSIVFYLSPILYVIQPRYEKFFFWNPMTPLLGLFRSALLGSPIPEARSIVFLVIVSGVLLVAGLFLFRRSQPTLADLI